ncbi:deoxyguanosinetriphosphate triphosphohydrolase family protein [Acetanaerobacterium elongatum]|uniref:dGTPase n=1 Tax=Acetanaerobacterium elongatum TaxID=258515 RepID=A0A1H0EQD6_9FIRM|nr:HD domain-containing protein [Acetanaerobacterium elongatum]SDN84558.1 dGTPase [Acetanaerobacterium elongatum]
MEGYLFTEQSARPSNPKYMQMIARAENIYKRQSDIRSEFGRDYTRILHSMAYRRLKHKTQVFFSPQNDHICTRIEHVSHVDSVSYTIADALGLNTELTRAIATAHDLGHAPFGHLGETVLAELSERDLKDSFWHERNGLRFVEGVELLENDKGLRKNLNLTYAVRDGIVSHCGEVDQNGIKPRDEAIDLETYRVKNQFAPFTWEGCVVKLADKIAYLGRDIEDAKTLGILDNARIDELQAILFQSPALRDIKIKEINNTVLIHEFILDLCENSSPQKGIALSKDNFRAMKMIKDFNYKNIYRHPRLEPYFRYAKLVLTELYDTLIKGYDGAQTPKALAALARYYPELFGQFAGYLEQYWDFTTAERRAELKLGNRILYQVKESQRDYTMAVLDYLSGMTDSFAVRSYNELISF